MIRLLWALCGLPAGAFAADVAAVAPSGLGGLVQVLFGLGVVLAVIFGCAWLFRRFSSGMLGGLPRHLRVVSTVMLGQRERVVIVELDDTWLVLGVTPQSITLLERRPRPAMEAAEAEIKGAEPFARWLKAAIHRQRHLKNDRGG